MGGREGTTTLFFLHIDLTAAALSRPLFITLSFLHPLASLISPPSHPLHFLPIAYCLFTSTAVERTYNPTWYHPVQLLSAVFRPLRSDSERWRLRQPGEASRWPAGGSSLHFNGLRQCSRCLVQVRFGPARFWPTAVQFGPDSRNTRSHCTCALSAPKGDTELRCLLSWLPARTNSFPGIPHMYPGYPDATNGLF